MDYLLGGGVGCGNGTPNGVPCSFEEWWDLLKLIMVIIAQLCISTVLCLVAQSCLALWDPMDCSPLVSSVRGDSPGKITGVGCHALLQGMFPTQESNPGLLHGRRILYHLSHQGSPRILEWVAYPFFRGTFWTRNWISVSCIADRFLPAELPRKPCKYEPCTYCTWIWLEC